MSSVIVGEDTINNVQVSLKADRYGNFSVTRKSDQKVLGSGDTLDAAKTKARTEINKTKARISVHLFTRNMKRAIATGIHGKTGKILVKITGEKGSEQFDQHQIVFKPDMPQDKRNRHQAISKEMAALKTEQRGIERDWEMRLGTEVQKALKEAEGS